jgi:ATP-binding cassette subfamily B (MDR/TAP) protein 1
MKYYEPLWGEMLIDGQSIQTLSSEWLRENITLVQQQSVVFNETLRHNIALGTRNPFTEEDIKAACKIAGLKQLISELPEGLNTIVGSNGRALSGGQQQRVAIARARLRDAPVLILDEATSALDQTSRMEVVAAIREWRQGRTTIIITHDISQILDDDYVYVLESGMVVQEGYCRVLAEKAHGTFSTFRSASQMVDGKPAEPRRNSEPASPTYTESSIDENEFPQRWGYISKIFGMHEAISNDVSKSMSIQGNNRMSLGVASIQANSLRADNIWSSPVISEPEFFSPHIMRTPLIPFMSPRSPPPKPSPDLRPLPLRREGLALIMAATNMSESVTTAGHPRSKPPPIDTTMSHPGALITKAQLTARLKREREPTRRRKIKPASLTKIFGTIWPTLTRMDRLILLFGFLAALVLAAATPAFAIVFAELLNVFYAKENQAAQARKWALSLLAIAVIDGVAAFCTHYALEYSGQAWVNSLRVEAMKRILNQPKSWFDSEKNSPSRLNECLDRNAEEMRNLIGRFAGLVFTAFWMLAISIVWSFTISWKLTLVALACAPVMYAITRTFHFTSNKWEDKCNKSSDATGSIFTETFSNIRVVRAFTLESHFNHKHDKVAADTYKIGLCRAAYAGLLFGLTDSVSFFITALIFYYGAKIISSGEGSVGSIIEVMNLLLFGIANATNLLSMVPQISSSRTTATQMLYLASLPQRDSHEAQGVTRIPTPFPIQFTNLSFTYPSKSLHTKALSDINLTITAGTCTAIVGPSGSGKSTLASILLGLYPPDPSTPEGSPAPLTFSGMSISNLNIHTLRHHLSIVPQTPLLFPSSILNNIAYGLSERSQYNNLASAIAAAKDAGIHDFIMSLENGYSTPIGDGGMGLSGGQAQRIAIARALVRCPKVLVLDEATSALDGVSAEGIRETIRRVTKRRGSSSSLGSEGDGERRGMAVVIISHNVEMMRVADVIVVIEDGRVVEKGAFEELKRKGGPFARLIGAGRESGANVMVVERLMTPVKARSRNSWIRETIV